MNIRTFLSISFWLATAYFVLFWSESAVFVLFGLWRSRRCDWISTRLEFWSQPKWRRGIPDKLHLIRAPDDIKATNALDELKEKWTSYQRSADQAAFWRSKVNTINQKKNICPRMTRLWASSLFRLISKQMMSCRKRRGGGRGEFSMKFFSTSLELSSSRFSYISESHWCKTEMHCFNLRK